MILMLTIHQGDHPGHVVVKLVNDLGDLAILVHLVMLWTLVMMLLWTLMIQGHFLLLHLHFLLLHLPPLLHSEYFTIIHIIISELQYIFYIIVRIQFNFFIFRDLRSRSRSPIGDPDAVSGGHVAADPVVAADPGVVGAATDFGVAAESSVVAAAQ